MQANNKLAHLNFYLLYFLIAASIFAFIALFSLVAVYAERKISAFIQDRLGPMEVGKFGLLQTFADILKLIQKEFIIPASSDKVLFSIAPVIIFLSVFLGFAAIPWSMGFIGFNTSLGVLYVFAIISIEALGILMAGWGSNNKYSLLGAVRSVAQIVSYEIPAGFAILSAVMISQTLNLQILNYSQGILATQEIKFFGFFDVNQIGGFLAWNVFQAPHLIISYIIYFISSLAECNRAPFDLPEAESELIGGFHTEYTGLRFAFIFLAEYAMMLLVAMLGVILFLGGWNTFLPNIGSFKLAEYTTGNYWGIFWLLSKSFIVVIVQIWIRWTLPRFRVDQLMSLCWKILTPLAFLCVILSGLWRLLLL